MIMRPAGAGGPEDHDAPLEWRAPSYENAFGRSPAWNQVIIE